jgi:AmpD protein
MAINMLVIHSISLPPDEFGGNAVEKFFTNQLDTTSHPYYVQLKDLRVSAHFFIRRNGCIFQFVACTKRAWHAGVSSWQERTRCNDFSIGIELEGSDTQPYTPRQYLALSRLARRIQRAYPIQNIVGHSDIAPQRKTDPGPHFDWAHFRGLLK